MPHNLEKCVYPGLPKLELIQDLKLFELVNLDDLEKFYQQSDPQSGSRQRRVRSIKEFLKRAIQYKDRLKILFNIKVNKKTKVMKLINLILEKFGLRLKSKRIRIGDELERIYQLNREQLNDLDRQAVLTGLTTKYKSWQQTKEWPIFENYAATVDYTLDRYDNDLRTGSFAGGRPNNVSNHSHDVKQPQAQNSSTLESVPHRANNIYNHSCDVSHPQAHSLSTLGTVPPISTNIQALEVVMGQSESQFILGLLADLEAQSPPY